MTESFLARWQNVIDRLPVRTISDSNQIAELIEAAVVAERERCVRIAEIVADAERDRAVTAERFAKRRHRYAETTLRQIAAAIRGEPEAEGR